MSIPGAIKMFQFTPYFTFHWFPERRPKVHSYPLPLVFRLCKRPKNTSLGIHSMHCLAGGGFEPTIFRL